MAIAAMISMMATTIRSSISEKPALSGFASHPSCVLVSNIFVTVRTTLKKKREEVCDFLPSIAVLKTLLQRRLARVRARVQVTSSAVAAESTRMTPVSSMQYAAVPVDNVTGPALTENPVQPEAGQAAGMPAVKAGHAAILRKCTA